MTETKNPPLSTAPPKTYDEFVSRYATDWVGFVSEYLSPPDEWQVGLLEAVQRGDSQISVVAGHGVGKSAGAAFAIICTMLFRFPHRVVLTAATAGQLFDVLFPEVKLWIGKLPPALQGLFDVKSESIELKHAPDDAFLTAKTSRAETPEAMAGVHCDDGWVLLVGDEASGIPDPVFEAAAGSMSGERVCMLLLGNPVRSSGYFFDTHNRLREYWTTFRVSCLDSPRIRAAWVEEMRVKYGEDSNAFRVRVLGLFPQGDDDTVIPMAHIVSSEGRDIIPDASEPVVWGLDVARFGSDRTALVKRKKRVLLEVPTYYSGLDTMQVAGRIKFEYDTTPEADRPVEILVDVIGYGAGVVDRLRELGLPVKGVNVAESPSMGALYLNLRAELWFKTRDWFVSRECAIPARAASLTPQERESMERLVEELSAVRFKVTSNGKMQVESKAEMKKRGMKSPDGADAFVLTFASSAATAIHGRDRKKDWLKPLRRNLRGVEGRV